MDYSLLINLSIILIGILTITISGFFISKTYIMIKGIKPKVRTQLDKISNVTSVIDLSDKLLSYIDNIMLIEVRKVILKSERVGKRYDVTRLSIDAEEICNTVIDCLSVETMNDIIDIFGKEWILSYISSNAFMLLVSSTAEYNETLGPTQPII